MDQLLTVVIIFLVYSVNVHLLPLTSYQETEPSNVEKIKNVISSDTLRFLRATWEWSSTEHNRYMVLCEAENTVEETENLFVEP